MAKKIFKFDPKLVVFFAVGVYLLYWREFPPFTKENKAKIKELFSFNPKPDPLPPLPDDDDEGIVPKSGAKVQLKGSDLAPKPKADPKITADFQREIYKQLYMPFDKYPFLYDDSYLDASRYISPGNPNYPGFTNPEGVLFGYRPPVKIDETHSGVPNYNTVYDSFSSDYGWYPPGGSYDTSLDDYYYNNPGDLITIGYKATAQARRAYKKEMKDMVEAEQEEMGLNKINEVHAFNVYKQASYDNSIQKRWDEYEKNGQKIGNLLKTGKRLAGV
jgi:hypothetical protein